MSENGEVLTEQGTLEKLGSLNEEFLVAATEVHGSVKDAIARGLFNSDEDFYDRVQNAINSIDGPMDKLLSFIGEINLADLPENTLHCLRCGSRVEIKRGRVGEPDYFADCPNPKCGWGWDIDGVEPDEAGSGEGDGDGSGDAPNTEGSPPGDAAPDQKPEDSPKPPDDDI